MYLLHITYFRAFEFLCSNELLVHGKWSWNFYQLIAFKAAFYQYNKMTAGNTCITTENVIAPEKINEAVVFTTVNSVLNFIT